MAITIKNSREIEAMREAGRVVAEVHNRLEPIIKPGVTTADLDAVARDAIVELGATSSFFGHQGFPGNICASVNDEIVHGIPGRAVMRDGDIISVDIGAIVRGYHGDSAWTYAVGTVEPAIHKLLVDTQAALYVGISAARAGNRLGAIGAAIEAFAAPLGYGIVRGYGGHGIGRQMWEEPHVPNHGDPRKGPILRPGMTLAIEPMLNLGAEATRVLSDNWTVVTADGSRSAHFEHTVVITEGEPLILTRSVEAMVY
ncbi:MAG: type I methionyl aminopeptidase [Chloroflexota bacterium]|nr:type I methionyl aminopeptidase [Chloroflexota bacterium]